MKYILGICNLVGVILLGYIMNICFKNNLAINADYEAMATKYKTECAAQVCYLTTLYHYGDWTTTLGDVLALEDGQTPSEGIREYEVAEIGTAISFEETAASYIVAFKDSVTAAMVPYTVYDDGTQSLNVRLDLSTGTYITRSWDEHGTLVSTTYNLDTQDAVVAMYTKLMGGSTTVAYDKQLTALQYARTLAINKLIANAMGLSGYNSQDTIYIANTNNKIPGINTIENQTVLVLQGTNVLTSGSTTLAAYTKTAKRQWCVISKTLAGKTTKFYCYNDEVPAGATVIALPETETEAAEQSVGRYWTFN